MIMMDEVIRICSLILGISSVFALFASVFKSIREIKNGMKCMLRKQMLDTYYKCKDSGEIRQYRYEAFMLSYQAYKALGGNSFIDHIKEEVNEFSVVS